MMVRVDSNIEKQRMRERMIEAIKKGDTEKIYKNPHQAKKQNTVKISFKKNYAHIKTKCRYCNESFTGREEGAVLVQIFKERNFFHTSNSANQNCWRKFVEICISINQM